jgi:hypothetical protein
MRKLKKIFLVMSCALLILGNTSTAFAATSDIAGQDNKAILIKSEKKVIDNVELDIRQYNDNGFVVETISVPTNSLASKSKNKASIEFNKKLKDYGYSRYLDFYGFNNNDILNTLSYTGDYYYNKVGFSPINSNCSVGHWGYMYATGATPPFKLESFGGACAGYYNNGNATSIQLSEYYDFSGSVSFSIYWPAGFGLTGSGSSRSWSSNPYYNTSMCTSYRPDFYGYGALSTYRLTIDSRSDVYLGSTSYASTVSSTACVFDWVQF